MNIKLVSLFSVFMAAAIGCNADGFAQSDTGNASPSEPPLLQAGPWFMNPTNIERLTINYLLTGEESWRINHPRLGDKVSSAEIDPETGLPHEYHGSQPLVSGWYLASTQPKEGFAGDWVIEIEGPGRVSIGLAKGTRRVSDRRVEWNFAPGESAVYASLSDIDGPLKALRIYRAEDEERLKAGKIWSGRFVEEISKYDIVRTMDIQNANGIMVRRADEIPPLGYHFWGNRKTSGTHFQSIPHEALVALAMEADVSLWFQASLFLGFPKDFDDLAENEKGYRHGEMRELARAHLDDILASPEWDKYADDFVAALITQNYPEDRTVYTSGLNEVWNFAGASFFWNTTYCDAIGEVLTGAGGGGRATQEREGYGTLMARWMMALDDALARAGRNQKVVYVIESHTASKSATRKSLDYAKRQIEQSGRKWSDYAPRMGVALTTYWGGARDTVWRSFKSPDAWKAAIEADPEGTAEAFADFQIKAGKDVSLTPAWVVAKWQNHASQAAPYGVKVIGAYEGGPHQKRPKYIPKEWYEAYLWGPAGGRINTALNEALATAFPGTILANYALTGGTGGDPWFDGLDGEDNGIKRSWAEFQRK